MTDRIQVLKNKQWERAHHKARCTLPADLPMPWRDSQIPDTLRTALRLQQALEMETPYLFANELIAFTRTVPNLPRIFDDREWAEITGRHYIHELGNVSNLSPDYAKVMSAGLLALRSKLGDAQEHKAMQISIDAVLELTRRYEAAAREAGMEELADTLARVPALPPRSFREALQSLRILHYAMWCEGDYHNTLGRFDQYMFPYLEADLAAGRETEESAFELLEALLGRREVHQ